ncbi:MAG: hypothetical protein K2N27_04925 [Ruminococcus sp.]|nr:hypothetical protein [Ruminococcus sp.]
MKNRISNTTSEKSVEYVTDSGIWVKINYPENVSEVIRQEKINHIYDILTRHSAK